MFFPSSTNIVRDKKGCLLAAGRPTSASIHSETHGSTLDFEDSYIKSIFLSLFSLLTTTTQTSPHNTLYYNTERIQQCVTNYASHSFPFFRIMSSALLRNAARLRTTSSTQLSHSFPAPMSPSSTAHTLEYTTITQTIRQK
jgi:hypothetical protein